MESPLSFNSTENFRKKLLARNLPAYRVVNFFGTDDKPAQGEFTYTDLTPVDSTPIEIIGDRQERILFPINQYGPEDSEEYGDMVQINKNLNYKSNEGQYDLTDTILSDLETIGDNSELYHIVKNVYKPQNNIAGFGSSVYFINDDKNILTIGEGEYTIVDTFNNYLERIGNQKEIDLKILNKWGVFASEDFGQTVYNINDVLTLSSFRTQSPYSISYTIGNELEFVGNTQEGILYASNQYFPTSQGDEIYGTTLWSINNDLQQYRISSSIGTGEYDFTDTIQSGLELEGVDERPQLFKLNLYRPENGQSEFEVEMYRTLRILFLSQGNYTIEDTVSNRLERVSQEQRPILFTINQYGSETERRQSDINLNFQTKSNEGEYGFPDTVNSELENIGQVVENITYINNKYGPSPALGSTTSYGDSVVINDDLLPADNVGPYGIDDTIGSTLEIQAGQSETQAYLSNTYSTGTGSYSDIDFDNEVIQALQLPYANSDNTFIFLPSTYTPYSILLQNNPTGSDGPLSQDSNLAKISANNLQKEFKSRIALELLQQTVGRVNAVSSSIDPQTGGISAKPNTDPFDVLGMATGNIPVIAMNYKITSPPDVAGVPTPLDVVDFAGRLAGLYSPYSYIIGELFDYPTRINNQNTFLQNTLSALGGQGGPIFNYKEPANNNASELLMTYTSIPTRSLIFQQLSYNYFRPDYQKGLSLLAPQPKFYIGDNKSSITKLVTPDVSELPLSKYNDNASSYGPVLSYSNLGKAYETNQLDETKFGINSRNYYSAGAAADGTTLVNSTVFGGFTWTSSDNYTKPGKLPQRGGADLTQWGTPPSYREDDSSSYDFTPGSLLDTTQKLVDAGNKSQYKTEHVGNAINQVSKIFNDGYQELTKGSRVVRYSTKTSVGEQSENPVGYEYCRVFTKDRPYYTYRELQKTDGNIRKYPDSVLTNTYNLNIVPYSDASSSSLDFGKDKVKKYMFSLENLAWRTSNTPGFTYEDLPTCEKGPNGGRIMWFPPYDLSFDENIQTSWEDNTFLGRPEPIYTYTNTTRNGNISFKILVDHPSVMNVLVDRELEREGEGSITQVIDSFIAGCTKYDIYDLIKKWVTFTPQEIFETQVLVREITETEFITKIPPPIPPLPPDPCSQYDYAVGNSATTINYTGCGQTTLTSRPLQSGATGTVCVEKNTVPYFTNAIDGTITPTGKPCNQPSTTPTPSPTPSTTPPPPTPSPTPTTTPPPTPSPTPSVTPAPTFTPTIIQPNLQDIGFYFHNDYPGQKTVNGVFDPLQAQKPFDEVYQDYLALKQGYLETGGTDLFGKTFGKARNFIFKYNDATYTQFTQAQIQNLSPAAQTQYLSSFIDARKDSVSKFFDYIDSEFNDAKKLAVVIGDALSQGKKVKFSLSGTASSVHNPDYNIKLSTRRGDSVRQWLYAQPAGSKKIGDYAEDGSIVVKVQTYQGEGGKLDQDPYKYIDCSKSFKNNSNEGVSSVNAMACRRVRIVDVEILDPVDNTLNNTGNDNSNVNNVENSGANGDGSTSVEGDFNASQETNNTNTSYLTSEVNDDVELESNNQTNPQPVESNNTFVSQTPSGGPQNQTPETVTRTRTERTTQLTSQRKKELTKKLGRKLLTECNYFDMIKDSDEMIYNGIKQKFKFFNPAFHSITPEGLNSRLTFLQQCMRPGDTIPTVSESLKGEVKLLFNDVTNSVFGSPPICVLRIGDFFHTKIKLDSLNFKYDDGKFDLNPEGIGVQPMIVDVTIGFSFIGAHGLAGPVSKLQNALSFNYYANTEMYDDRADDTAKNETLDTYDKLIEEEALNRFGVVANPSNRGTQNDGGVPIGTMGEQKLDIQTNIVTGNIRYQNVMQSLVDKSKEYFEVVEQTLSKVNDELFIGGLQLLTKEREYTSGSFNALGSPQSCTIYGKSINIETRVNNLKTKAKEDVDNNDCPILALVDNSNFSDIQIRKVKRRIQDLIDAKAGQILGVLEVNNSTITAKELEWIGIVDKLNYIMNGNDGYITKQGNAYVYNISGTTQITAPYPQGVTNTLQELTQESYLVKNDINDFIQQLSTFNVIPSGSYEYNDSFSFDTYIPNYTPAKNRFFILFGTDILKKPQDFINSIINVAIPNAGQADKDAWDTYFTNIITTPQTGLGADYLTSKNTQDANLKKFRDDYYSNKYTNYRPYDVSKERLCALVTKLPPLAPSDSNMKDLYSQVNSGGNKFNLKKSFP